MLWLYASTSFCPYPQSLHSHWCQILVNAFRPPQLFSRIPYYPLYSSCGQTPKPPTFGTILSSLNPHLLTTTTLYTVPLHVVPAIYTLTFFNDSQPTHPPTPLFKPRFQSHIAIQWYLGLKDKREGNLSLLKPSVQRTKVIKPIVHRNRLSWMEGSWTEV